MYQFNWLQMAQEQWMRNANDGYIVVNNDADLEWCGLVNTIIEKWIVMPETKPRDVLLDIVDCQSGYSGSWQLAHKLVKVPCRTVVRDHAYSAGLFLFMAGEERLADPNANFIFHGNIYRMMVSGANNADRATWFSSRTNMSWDWWFEKAQANEILTFGFGEAMKWGVATGETK